MKIRLTFVHDPGHGWLQVPMEYLDKLGVKDHISTYSYALPGLAFLEEDLDAGTFLRAAEKAGWTVDIESRYDDPTPIRNYPSYPAHPSWAILSGWKKGAA